MSSSFKISDTNQFLRSVQFNSNNEAAAVPSDSDKTDERISEIIAPLMQTLRNSGTDDLDLDLYPSSMLTTSALNISDDGLSNADPEQEFKEIVKGFNNFAKVFLRVQLTNIASGAEITAAVEEAQKLLSEAQADFSKYLQLNATLKSKMAELNVQLRDDEMRIKYKEMSAQLREAAEKQMKIAEAMIAAGATMLAAGLALMAACGAGTPLAVAGAAMLAAGILQAADADAKLKAVDQMDQMLNDTSKPLDEVALRSLAKTAQVGLSDSLAFKIISFVVALASAAASGGANINSLLTVIGYVAEFADMIANKASDEYHDAKPNDNDDLNRTKKAMNYLKKLTSGVAGAVNIIIEVVLVEVAQRLLYGVGDDDKRTPEEKKAWEIVKMVLEGITALAMAFVGTKAGLAEDGGGKWNKRFFGNLFMEKANQENPISFVIAKTISTALNVAQTVVNGFREYDLAAAGTSNAELNAILTKLKSALDLLNKLNSLKDQLTADQQKMLEDAQATLAADINDLIKTIQGMLDNMNNAISNTVY